MNTPTRWTNVDMSTPDPRNNPQPNMQGCAQKGSISESRASNQMYTRVDMSTCPPLRPKRRQQRVATANLSTPALGPMCGDAC